MRAMRASLYLLDLPISLCFFLLRVYYGLYEGIRIMRGIRGLVKRVSRVMRVMVEEVRWYDGLRGI